MSGAHPDPAASTGTTGATRRVVLIGPECSGKTTLASALAGEFGAPWTPEAARRFAESHEAPLSALTVEPIARLSMALEDAALAARPPLLVRDTDLVSTVVYARHYYGSVAPWIEAEARARLADLYLLCRPDLPWSPDGIRDRPMHRDLLFEEFRSALAALGARVAEVGGTGPARLEAARAAVRGALAGAPAR